MTRSRARRNGNARKKSIPRSLISKFTESLTLTVRNTSAATLVNAGHIFSSGKSPLHHNNGVVGSSPDVIYLGQNIFGLNVGNGGVFVKGVLLKAKLTTRILNLESFPVIVNVGYLNNGSYAIYANNTQVAYEALADKTIHLEKTGVFGDIKVIVQEYDIPKLEGNLDKEAFIANTSNWATYASAASTAQGYYIQCYDFGQAINAVNGVECNQVGEFTFRVIQRNENLIQ